MIKRLYYLFVIFLIVVSCKKSNTENNFTESVKNDSNFWMYEKAKEHYQNRNDSLKWDNELFLTDLEYIDETSKNPMEFGVFPILKYNLLGENSFKGLGVSGNRAIIKNKNVVYKSFWVKQSELNKHRLSDKNSEVFFNIVVLTDTLDLKNKPLSSVEVISRNHPNYIGQGMVKTKNSKIEFIAFTTVDNNSYAIVNMRLFNLKFGKTILIAPQVDKSFRSMQVEMPMIEFEELENYMTNLLKEKRIIDFLTKKGNI
ncbi:MAG: hypothetical protein L3J25_11060 [Flavobacteriaceae bacterium]|nr:hypothetical protein [Flavobacteriaceae bacterium]